MYANLKVTQSDGSALYAWYIDVNEHGDALVSLDGNDGTSNYAVEAGEKLIRPPFTIEVDF